MALNDGYTMPTTSILKPLQVENPSCIWGRVFWGPGGDAETTEEYSRLMAQMNLFYCNLTQDLRKLKPTSLEEGQVCVVYWSVMKLWCRALVESVIVDSVSYKALCFLVDHGERLVVSSDQVQVAVQNFLQLPFWVRKFHLARIKPTTLRVPLCDKAKLIPSTQWDSSATLYLHRLLQVSTQTEAVLLEPEEDSTSIMLYVTVGNIKMCVNDDLVAKKFALYDRSHDDSGLHEADQYPIMLSSSILTQTRPAPASVMSPGSAVVGAGALLTPPSSPQSQRRVLEASEEGSQSQSSSDSAAADGFVESDGSNQPAALSVSTCSPQQMGGGLPPAPPPPVPRLPPDVAVRLRAVPEPKDGGPEETTAASSACTGQEVLIPSSNGDPGTSHEQAVLRKRLSGRSVEAGAAEEMLRSEEDLVCSRLLEWLNPDQPLIPDVDSADTEVLPGDPTESGVLVHSAVPLQPCSSLDDAPILDSVRSVLRRKRYISLSLADRYSWPAVARGCNTVIISHGANQPLSYLAPLLSHILLNSVFTSLTSSTGPIAVLLCPGWEKVQAVHDLLEEIKVAPTLHPTVVLLGVGKDEAKGVKIPKNCLLLVTTPFSLVRLLSCHCFLFLRMYHLVLDEADRLFTQAPDQMATILQHFQKVTSTEEKTSCCQQLVAVARRWTEHMDGLLANHMPFPCIVSTVPEEVGFYGDVQQIILMTLESSKISVLLGALDFNPSVGQKTVIVANTAQEVEEVFKGLSSRSAFCLMTHEGLSHQFDPVMQQWRRGIGRGTHVFLATTDACLKSLGVRDATCVVHYSFPSSPAAFGRRLFCLAENFRNLCEQPQADSRSPVTRSVLLISERNASHGVGILRYMERTDALLPPELLSFVQGVLVAREEQKTDRPLCTYLKSFGVCRDSSVCPDRHRLVSHLDQSVLPASGLIQVVPLHIKAASVFSGRIIKKEDDSFQNLVAEMTSHFADKKPGATDVLVGGLYAVQEDEDFHRVKVLAVARRGDSLFSRITVQFIDVGKEEEVRSFQILQLPEQFHHLPGQAVEIILCRVKPADGEADWHPKVTRAIRQKIRGVQHQARAVLSLGNTVFVDPMVRVSQVPGVKTVINEYSVQSEILSSGMAVTNPEHVDLLRALCGDAGQPSGSGESPASQEAGLKGEEEALAEALRAGFSRLHPRLSPASPEIQTQPALDPAAAPAQLEPLLVSQVASNSDDGELCPPASHAAALSRGENGDLQHAVGMETACQDTTTSFHPQLSWYQKSDTVTVTVKLVNPERQSCEFYPDRVVYSGRVNGRTYRADLELQADVAAERCSWEMKSNQPVLKLVKQQQGCWDRLLRTKNIFVTYDMEHFEEDEDVTPAGVWFVENTGESWCVKLDSSSSDSD